MRSADTNRYYLGFLAFLGLVTLLHVAEYNRLVTVDRLEPSDGSAVKVILSWNPFFGDAFYGFGEGERAFARHGCAFANCRITADKLEMPQHRFHAVLFHGFEFYEVFYGKPRHRGPEQRYVFFSLESARRTAIPRLLHDFYNVSMTYRLDSDVPWPYFKVRDRSGTFVAPAASVRWLEPPKTRPPDPSAIRKRRKIAWFVSNCGSTNRREAYVRELRRYVEVDVFGACGEFECPARESARCSRMLREDYYFYLAFENSHCSDYLTEKVLTAFQSEIVPIVFAHAELSRFLPPHSYLDANLYSPMALADEVNRLIGDPTRYAEYLWWRGEYVFEKTMPGDEFPPGEHPFCQLCRVLNEGPAAAAGKSVRTWWMGTGLHPTCLP